MRATVPPQPGVLHELGEGAEVLGLVAVHQHAEPLPDQRVQHCRLEEASGSLEPATAAAANQH